MSGEAEAEAAEGAVAETGNSEELVLACRTGDVSLVHAEAGADMMQGDIDSAKASQDEPADAATQYSPIWHLSHESTLAEKLPAPQMAQRDWPAAF